MSQADKNSVTLHVVTEFYHHTHVEKSDLLTSQLIHTTLNVL